MTSRLVAIFAAALSVAAVLPAKHVAAQEKTWLVVEVSPLSGRYSTVGIRLSKPAKMWADEVNKRGGIRGRKIQLVTCNDESRPEKSVACARDAVRDGAVMVLAHGTSATVRAVMPVLKDGPVLIVPSPNVVPAPDTLVFQTSPTDADLLDAIAKYLDDNRVKKLSMIAATDAAGEAQVAAAQAVFKKHNTELNLQRIDMKATDASAQIATLMGADAKVLFSSYSGAGAAVVVKSYANLGLKQPLIISYANLSEAFTQVIKDYLPPRLLGVSVRGFIPEAIKDPELRQRAVKFMQDYQTFFNEPADMINILGKFDVDVAEAILTHVDDPTDSKAVKAFLEKSVVESLHRIKFAPDNHVGLGPDDLVIAEFNGKEWKQAAPLQ